MAKCPPVPRADESVGGVLFFFEQTFLLTALDDLFYFHVTGLQMGLDDLRMCGEKLVENKKNVGNKEKLTRSNASKE